MSSSDLDRILNDDSVPLRPFYVCGSLSGVISQHESSIRSQLESAGFQLLGSYHPYASWSTHVKLSEKQVKTSPITDVDRQALILVITHADLLLAHTVHSQYGGFGAVLRVSLTQVEPQLVQVCATNAEYLCHAYKMQADLKPVNTLLQKTLGYQSDFGSKKGLTAKKLRKYHYAMGMEYFHEVKVCAEFTSYGEACQLVDSRLTQGQFGVKKVYRVDIPGKEETVFGVSLDHADKYATDAYIMYQIDHPKQGEPFSTPHLPYEILVVGNKVVTMHARFRIAINFPDLDMMGSHSFASIMDTPDAIVKALRQTCQNNEKPEKIKK